MIEYKSTRNHNVIAQLSIATGDYILYLIENGEKTPLAQINRKAIEEAPANWYKIESLYEVGFVAGAFDCIHPGYIALFKEAKHHCKRLIVLIHEDPSIDRKQKLTPCLSIQDRIQILLELQSVDSVAAYRHEEELHQWISDRPDYVRFLGEDYKHANYTGKLLPNPVIFMSREHEWSTTKYKELIANSVAAARLLSTQSTPSSLPERGKSTKL